MNNVVTISDGTEVELKSPGVAYEVEVLGSIPSLGLIRERKAGEVSVSAVDELRARLIAICLGAVSPRFSMEAGVPGMRYVGDLLPVDVGILADRVLGLRADAMAQAEATLRPTEADAHSSKASANSGK